MQTVSNYDLVRELNGEGLVEKENPAVSLPLPRCRLAALGRNGKDPLWHAVGIMIQQSNLEPSSEIT